MPRTANYNLLLALLIAAAATTSRSHSFVLPSLPSWSQTRHLALQRQRPQPLAMNFFKDVIGKAFDNDASLDKNDITKGQYDGPGEEFDDDDSFTSVGRLVNKPQLTETQQKWRNAQQTGGGAKTPQLLLSNTKWSVDLFLTGIPERDPSNDLFASKVNISLRDRKVGLLVPEEPTVPGITMTLLEDGVIQFDSDSEFLDNQQGQWKVSDDGLNVRICMNVLGYQRTVKTKGSIEKIYWSSEEEKSVQTSATYSIPAGPLYGDAGLETGAQVGTLKWTNGILRVEQSVGLLGAGSKMTPCGRFEVKRVDSES